MVKVTSDDPKAVEKQIQGAVEGNLVEFNDYNLAAVSDLVGIRKIYKLGRPAKTPKDVYGINAQQGVEGRLVEDQREERKEVESIILGIMALRGAA